MNLLVWLEGTGLAEWVRVSTLGYPLMITLHSLGLAIMVGLSTVLSLRVIGVFTAIPTASLAGLLKIAWIGFIINTISGTALFAAQASSYPSNTQFMIKISLVFLGAILVAWLQSLIKSGASTWVSTGTPMIAKAIAVLTIIAWTGGMVTGRLIAYLS